MNDILTASTDQATKDDRIYPVTRWISAVILPFLILAFIILYFFPGQAAVWFAWPVKPDMTAMYMGAGYLGGAYLFLHAIFGRRWHRVAAAFPAVTAYTISMVLATILHWDRFNHGSLPFNTWLVLYILTPVLLPAVWFYNRRTDPGAFEEADAVVPPLARYALGLLGAVLLVLAVIAFISPELLMQVWPWNLTVLTARVMAGWFALLGVGGLVNSRDPRWSAWMAGLESIAIWHLLVLVAAALNPADFTGGYPLNGYLVSVGLVLLGMAILYIGMQSKRKRRS